MSAQNQQFMKFLGALFGMRQQMGIGPTSNTKGGSNEFRSVQAGQNATALTEQEKEKKKKDKADAAKKRKAIQTTSLKAKGTIMPALNNKSLASSLSAPTGGSSATGINFAGKVAGKKKSKSGGLSSSGLNINKKY